MSTCASSLWSAVQKGVEELSVEHKTTEISRWKAPKVRITFPPGLLSNFTMKWTNRSTFQQVIEFTGEAPEE